MALLLHSPPQTKRVFKKKDQLWQAHTKISKKRAATKLITALIVENPYSAIPCTSSCASPCAPALFGISLKQELFSMEFFQQNNLLHHVSIMLEQHVPLREVHVQFRDR